MDKQKVLQWIDEVLKTDGWIADKKDHYDTIWLTKFRDEIASGRFDLQVSQDFCGHNCIECRFCEEQKRYNGGEIEQIEKWCINQYSACFDQMVDEDFCCNKYESKNSG